MWETFGWIGGFTIAVSVKHLHLQKFALYSSYQNSYCQYLHYCQYPTLSLIPSIYCWLYFFCVSICLLDRNAPDCVLRHHVHHSQWLQPPSGLCWAKGRGGGPTGGPRARSLPGWWAPDHLRLPGYPHPEPGAHCWLLPWGKFKCTTVTPQFPIEHKTVHLIYSCTDSVANYIISPQSATLLPESLIVIYWCSGSVLASLLLFCDRKPMCLPFCWVLVCSSLLRGCWPGCVSCASNSSSWIRAHSIRSALHHTQRRNLYARTNEQKYWGNRSIEPYLCSLATHCGFFYWGRDVGRTKPLASPTTGKSAQVWSQNPAAADGVDRNVPDWLQRWEDGWTPERHHPQDSSMWWGTRVITVQSSPKSGTPV